LHAYFTHKKNLYSMSVFTHYVNHNSITHQRLVLFVDMNSFFARCEQQVNYWLRGRPVAVCVYTGRFGAAIALSTEAKQRGLKAGKRLDELMAQCPDLVPIETHPQRYREFHVKIMNVLKKYSDEVIPKSIDEAIMDISSYRLLYKDPRELALKIKADIKKEVGDWLTCSIGIAPNAFLAKLATEIQKPDGLVLITPENIDEVLAKLQLTDLPGIAEGNATRLIKAGIRTPLELRYATPQKLKNAMHSIVGVYWHYRLNFKEVDQVTHDYKAMQAMRQISRQQRQSLDTLNELITSLCMRLEQRMVRQKVYCKEIDVYARFENGSGWKDRIKSDKPIQSGTEVLKLIKLRMHKFEQQHHSEPIINHYLTAFGITVTDFVPEDMINLNLFEDTVKDKNLRKVVYDIKNRFGKDKVMKAAEAGDERVLKDVIGFGSIKDFYVDGEFDADYGI
jgi:DNA polymerase-4